MNRQLVFDGHGFDDYLYWQTQDRKTLKRINMLISDIDRNGYDGIGKPEPLKYENQGYWSRRIDDEHRLVYYIKGNEIHIMSCRFHYGE
jgi:toxin YoeB